MARLAGQRRDVFQHAEEVALLDDEHRRVGGDGRGAGPWASMTALTTEPGEGRDLLPPVAVDDDERLAPHLPLVGQDVAGGHGELVRGPRDRLELLVGA
jgi:hypothetical protein